MALKKYGFKGITVATGEQAVAAVEPLRDAAGNIIGATGVTWDITRRKRAEQALARALQKKDALYREFQHRMKNTLNRIDSLVSLEAEHAAEPSVQAVLEKLDLRLALQEFALSPRSASAFGLILNEWITNALKYAFPGDRRGFVSGRLQRAGGRLVLEVEDNRLGLPAGFDLASMPGLGLMLVKLLANQLGGQVYAEYAQATRFGIRLEQEQML